MKLPVNKIIQGDCRKVMRGFPDNSVDLVVTDPPYGGLSAADWDKLIDLSEWWNVIDRITKKATPIVMFGIQPFVTDLINSNRDNFRYCYYWNKNIATNFLQASQKPLRVIEEIMIFYRSIPIYNPQKTTGHSPANSAKGSSVGNVYHGTNTRNYKGGITERYPTNLLKFKCSNYNFHSNEKPISIIKFFIKTYSNPNDLICDPFCGSGTTCVAAKELGRPFIGIELEPKYVAIAEQRLAGVNQDLFIKVQG